MCFQSSLECQGIPRLGFAGLSCMELFSFFFFLFLHCKTSPHLLQLFRRIELYLTFHQLKGYYMMTDLKFKNLFICSILKYCDVMEFPNLAKLTEKLKCEQETEKAQLLQTCPDSSAAVLTPQTDSHCLEGSIRFKLPLPARKLYWQLKSLRRRYRGRVSGC